MHSTFTRRRAAFASASVPYLRGVSFCSVAAAALPHPSRVVSVVSNLPSTSLISPVACVAETLRIDLMLSHLLVTERWPRARKSLQKSASRYQAARRCAASPRLTQGAACQLNLCPIQLILRRLCFLVGRDEVPVGSANSLSPSEATCCRPFLKEANCWSCRFCRIMTPRDSLAVRFLSCDESEENTICHVSTDVSTSSCLLCFCLGFLLWEACRGRRGEEGC